MATTSDFNFSAKVSVMPTAKAKANYQRFCDHAVAEWSGDLDATMRTMSPDDPFQIFHGTKAEIRGFEAVRNFYEERMRVFSGQGFHAQEWVVSDDVAVGRGWFKGAPSGPFLGTTTYGKSLFFPFTLWLYFDDQSLIKGEAAYFDRTELERQIAQGQDGDVTQPLY